jgi:[ribosomal protein S5]-alanine N-acetyltransferase
MMEWKLPILTTERLTLRAVTMDDAEEMFTYGSNENVTKYVLWQTHETIRDTKEFIEMALETYAMQPFYHWGIVYKEKFIGTIDYVMLQQHNKVGEIGYVLAEEYWNKGIVTEAAKRVIDFGFQELGLVRIQARCVTENTGSARVMEKSGMTYEGTLRKALLMKGTHRDVEMYAITDEDQRS